MKKLALIPAALAALLASTWVHAESDVNTAAGPNTSASANVDFQVVIPRVLFLQVGTGTLQADNTTVDQISFTVPVANLGDSTPVAASVGSGDQGNGAVTVRLFGNGGAINLTAASPSGADLVNAAGDTIPWTEIDVTATAGTTASGYTGAVIPHPTINSATGVTISATNKVIREVGTWTYAYKNTAAYAEGTYGGTNTQNSRVTYTASMP